MSSYFFDCAHDVYKKGYLVDIVVPEFYFNGKDESQITKNIGKVTIDDGPIVVFIKLKEDLIN